jgi:hypothetical protein
MVAIVFCATTTLAQQEKGDVEVQLSFSVIKIEDFTSGYVQLKLGSYVSDNLEIGIAPSVQISTNGETETTTGIGLFASYSFLADSEAVPYLGLQYYVPDVEKADELSSAGINAGVKYYFTEKTAFDLSLNYLFAITEEEDTSGLFLIMGGLSYLF